MNKLKSFLKDRRIKPAALARVIGRPTKNTEFGRWFKKDISLLDVDLRSVLMMSKAFGVGVEDMLLDLEADGTLPAIDSVKDIAEKIGEVLGHGKGETYEGFDSVGYQLGFAPETASKLARKAGLDPKNDRLGYEDPLPVDELEKINEGFDPGFKAAMEEIAHRTNIRKCPVKISYRESDGVYTFVVAIFRLDEDRNLIEKVEVIKAVFSDDPENGWIKYYANALYRDFMDYDAKAEENPVTREEYFDILGKVFMSIKSQKR